MKSASLSVSSAVPCARAYLLGLFYQNGNTETILLQIARREEKRAPAPIHEKKKENNTFIEYIEKELYMYEVYYCMYGIAKQRKNLKCIRRKRHKLLLEQSVRFTI